MADETIKYSKNESTDAFENFEPWHYGEPAIPNNLYFLGVNGNGYQQYFNTNGYGVKEINATDSDNMPLFEINGKPIRGCVKGTVVTAKELASGQRNVEIWFNKNEGKVYYKFIGDSGDKAVELKDSSGIIPKRLGIALVGGGGACGGAKSEHWKNDCCRFDTEMPGGGGGGGGIVWGIINLDDLNENENYMITVGNGGQSQGSPGKDTKLSYILSTERGTFETALAIAGGGKGGGTGKKSGATGGVGGICTFAAKSNYFIFCGQQSGKPGGSYAEVDEGNETQEINSSVEANEFSIAFIPDGDKKAAGDKSHNGIGTTVKQIAENEGKVYLAVPGGNSYGWGGYPIGNRTLYEPTWGGGGMCWTYDDYTDINGKWCESIWADTADNYISNSSAARCGANGGWILFY